MTERVILVDEDDRMIGTEDKLAAHRRNLRHRAISVFILDSRGRMLLQQRASGKYHSARLWTNACCTHPRLGEAPESAAGRRLQEELGITCRLSPVARVAYQCALDGGLFENEVVHVFAGQHDGVVAPDPAEVADFDWRTPAAIHGGLEREPDAFTAWFRIYAREPWFDGLASSAWSSAR